MKLQGKYITYVFKIVDEEQWQKQTNPMYKDHVAIPGLRCVGMSAGDLMAMSDAFEEADPSAFEKAHREHVMVNFREDAP